MRSKNPGRRTEIDYSFSFPAQSNDFRFARLLTLLPPQLLHAAPTLAPLPLTQSIQVVSFRNIPSPRIVQRNSLVNITRRSETINRLEDFGLIAARTLSLKRNNTSCSARLFYIYQSQRHCELFHVSSTIPSAQTTLQRENQSHCLWLIFY